MKQDTKQSITVQTEYEFHGRKFSPLVTVKPSTGVYPGIDFSIENDIFSLGRFSSYINSFFTLMDQEVGIVDEHHKISTVLEYENGEIKLGSKGTNLNGVPISPERGFIFWNALVDVLKDKIADPVVKKAMLEIRNASFDKYLDKIREIYGGDKDFSLDKYFQREYHRQAFPAYKGNTATDDYQPESLDKKFMNL